MAVAYMETNVVAFMDGWEVVESKKVGNISLEGIMAAISAESPCWIVGCINVEAEDNRGDDKGTEGVRWFRDPQDG